MYKSVIVPRFGGPEVLQVVEKEIPAPAPNECRVKVLAAGVARVDSMMRTGLYPVFTPLPPFCPGRDIAGIVDAVGKAVETLRVGEMVAAYTNGNGYAEYICLPESALVPFSSQLDPRQVACLPLNYITAYQLLHRFAKVKKGERVLIHGAGSGVGTALIQLGALVDLEMYGTASPAKHETIYRLGATPIDYKSEDFVKKIFSLTGDGVDVVLDHVGGRHLWKSFKTLRPGGRMIAYGELSWASGNKINQVEKLSHSILLKLLKYAPKRIVRWYELDPAGGMIPPEWYREDLRTLINLLQREKIKPIIAAHFPLVEAVKAHKLFDETGITGKIILTCNG